MAKSIIKNSRKIHAGPSTDPSLENRIYYLENNEYKITYYEIVSGASGTLTVPSQATINEGEFGASGNAILSEIGITQKPTFKTPQTAGGIAVTASLNHLTGDWLSSGVYTSANVALIYSISILAKDYQNLDFSKIIESEELDYDIATQGAVDTGTVNDQIVTPKTLKNSSQWNTKEDAVNKVTTMVGNETSNIVFLTAKAIYDWTYQTFTPGISSITPDTKTKITYNSDGLVTSGADATTADISDSSNRRYITDAQLVVVGNTSGTNTGDNATNSQYSGLVTNATHTGDATGATVLTLATVNSNVGTLGAASKSLTITTNAKGLTTAISEQNIAIAESQVTGLVSDLAAKLPIQVPQTTGVSLTFTTDQVYGTIGSPETGNITYSTTGALLGVTNIIIHNHSVAPTFAANMKKLSGSGTYIINVVNYIYVTYINSTEVIYSINQRT